jgi:D-alanyl-D-alanine carboxypeptidase/D-alanyl-D-alanine-endopeptidase (penicillin-binding protein 4)
MLPNCPESALLSEISSPPLSEVVKAILEPSQNWMTEQLVHALGMELGKEGSWSEGFKVEEEFLTQVAGVDSLDIHFRDGSGLAAYNLVTPRALVRLLEFLQDSPQGVLFRSALAEPGEKDSTLSRRLLGLEGQLYAKTGTISHVNSLSGYLVPRGGRPLIFSILTNGSGLPSSTVRQGIDQVVRILLRH